MTCRICYEDEPTDKLISVCGCRGTSEFVHEHCIIQWIRTSRRSTCEICHERYNISPILYPHSGIVCLLAGCFISVAHAILLRRQVVHFPNDVYSVMILTLLSNTIQFLLWMVMKKDNMSLQCLSIPVWFFSFMPLSLILQNTFDGMSTILISWVITPIFYIFLSAYTCHLARQG